VFDIGRVYWGTGVRQM